MKKRYYLIFGLILAWIGVMLVGYFSPDKKFEIQTETKQIKNNFILFYNRDIIPEPPITWQEFMNLKNSAIGTADNIEYSSEILVLLMLQQGTDWPDFNNNLGEIALKFYTQFADSSKKVYTWNNKRNSSFEEFASGSVAMIFAYNQDKEKFANINYAIAEIPALDPTQNINLPQLPESEKAVLDEMIESVISGRKSVEQAISIGAEQIKDLHD